MKQYKKDYYSSSVPTPPLNKIRFFQYHQICSFIGFQFMIVTVSEFQIT